MYDSKLSYPPLFFSLTTSYTCTVWDVARTRPSEAVPEFCQSSTSHRRNHVGASTWPHLRQTQVDTCTYRFTCIITGDLNNRYLHCCVGLYLRRKTGLFPAEDLVQVWKRRQTSRELAANWQSKQVSFKVKIVIVPCTLPIQTIVCECSTCNRDGASWPASLQAFEAACHVS